MTGPGPHNAGSTPQPPQHQPQPPPAAGSSRRNLIVAVAVIALIVIIGLVVWLVTKKSPDQGAPQTGSIQQPAVSSAGGYTPIDPATKVAPGRNMPNDVRTFLDATALPSFMKFANGSSMKDENASDAACWYPFNVNGQWLAVQSGGDTGTIVCGPTKGDGGRATWWEHTVVLGGDGNQQISTEKSQLWNPVPNSGVPNGFRPDGRPIPAAG